MHCGHKGSGNVMPQNSLIYKVEHVGLGYGSPLFTRRTSFTRGQNTPLKPTKRLMVRLLAYALKCPRGIWR